MARTRTRRSTRIGGRARTRGRGRRRVGARASCPGPSTGRGRQPSSDCPEAGHATAGGRRFFTGGRCQCCRCFGGGIGAAFPASGRGRILLSFTQQTIMSTRSTWPLLLNRATSI